MNARRLILLASVFVVAVCGLVYELLAGALSSYLLGDSVTQFSIVIGVFLSAMGLGAWLSKFVEGGLLSAFIVIEVWLGLAGGFSALALSAAFAFTEAYPAFLLAVGGAVGTLVGFEVPLLIRILKEGSPLKVTVSDVLTVDYAGALAASVLFPTLLVPHLGMMRTAFLFGLFNVGVAAASVALFRERLGRPGRLAAFCALAGAALVGGLAASERLSRGMEAERYEDEVIFARQTRHQRIVLTRWREDLRLYLDGNLQFSTVDEHRYHEALVHPAMALAGRVERVLVLGGGDGMALREVLKHPSVREAVLVDIDPDMTRLFATNPVLRRLNGGSLSDPRARVVNRDALSWLRDETGTFDVIVMDLPDPNNLSLGKLYTQAFFTLALRRLRAGGFLVTQATSPFYAPEAFWCIVGTLRASAPGLFVRPYHVDVPSFGEWGFALASRRPFEPSFRVPGVPLRYLNEEAARALFAFPRDQQPMSLPVNRLDDQVLVRLYENGWRRFNQ